MEKRLTLAIALSILIVLGWSALMPKQQPIANKTVTDKTFHQQEENSLNVGQLNSVSSATVVPARSVETLVFAQDDRDIVFDANTASISEVVFKDGAEHRFPLKSGFLTDGRLFFKKQGQTEDSITFLAEDRNQQVFKKFFIPKSSNTIDLEVRIKNISSSPFLIAPQLVLGCLDLSSNNKQSRYQDVFLGTDEKNMHVSAGKNFNRDNAKFLGVRDQYFCAIVEPDSIATKGYIKKISPAESETGLFMKEVVLNPGDQIGHIYHIYLGPQDLKKISAINPDWTSIIYFGVFDFIAQLLLQLLGFFYSLVHNWGVAIIILSAVVYLLLFPLSLKQMKSMKEMQLLQPKIESLRKELKDNPQKLNKEIMELYKEHKVNPLGGCLPLLLQMPIFFALYQALMRSADLRGAHFLWITDLSAPDRAFVFKNSLPFLGNQLNILPILMAIIMFIQQKISMPKSSGDSAQQQKMMLIIMPIMFGVIFYQMPSGLVLYWFINSLFMLFYQFKINKAK
jgi:YidC/Oxa1 family membrane protein insertase